MYLAILKAICDGEIAAKEVLYACRTHGGMEMIQANVSILEELRFLKQELQDSL